MSAPRIQALFAFLCLLAAACVAAREAPELKFEKYTLDNGLQVILHEDHNIPLAAVNVWYHVGSKNEKPGRTGFAHLFEHMMFQGSANHDKDYFLPLQKIGAQVNGSTNTDRTNYWENVPSDQLKLALFLEADRMGFLLPAMTQEKLDNQRDVVKNEKRQGENRPYAKSREMLLEMMYPAAHPYRWSVIGSMDDLSAASIEDVSEFFRLYYAPNNASLCVAGDFDPAEVKRWINEYFGTIPPGRPVERLTGWTPTLDGERRALAEDAVELPRLYMQWHSPGWYHPGDAECDLLAGILGSGKTSRLYKTLVYDLQIAQDVRVSQSSRELSGTFGITATAASGHGLAEIEEVIDRELALLLEKGVTKKEVDLARTSFEAGFVRDLQEVGGFGGKADRLNRYNVLTGDPGYLERDLGRYVAATAASVNEWTRRFIDPQRRAVLYIVPQGALKPAEVAVQRDELPESTGETSFTPPAIRTATLDNGLQLFLVEKHELPLVEIRLNIMRGWASDPADKPGTAALTADLLDEGAGGLDALQISENAEAIGARLRTGSFFDGSFVSLNVLASQLKPGLDLMRAVALQPTFPQEDFERLRQNYLGRQQQESRQPREQALREFQRRIFGAGHPYSQPFSGSGTPESLAALTRDDLVAFHETYFRPGNAAVVVVGDLDLDQAVAAVTRAFGGWAAGTSPAPVVPSIGSDGGPRIVVIDKPGAEQSYVVGGYAGLSRKDPAYQAFQLANTAFGGQFASRINLNLREDKGYTYGVRSAMVSFRDGGLFMMTAPVETQATCPSVLELIGEMAAIRGPRPLSASELTDSRNRLIMGFPQEFQTYGDVAGSLGTLLLNDLPVDDWRTFADRVTGLTAADVAAVIEETIDPDRVVWVIVGDWSVIGDDLQALGLGEVEVVAAGQS
jgi:zinc protease